MSFRNVTILPSFFLQRFIVIINVEAYVVYLYFRLFSHLDYFIFYYRKLYKTDIVLKMSNFKI